MPKSDGGRGKRPTRELSTAETQPRFPRPIAKAPPRRDPLPVLQGFEAPFANLSFRLAAPRLMVGRAEPADLLLDDDSVSRRHAEIVRTGAKVSVRDLGSSNGTFVNGVRVTEAPLEPGDVVRFGVVELCLAGPGAGAQPATAQEFGGRTSVLLLVAGGAALVAGLGALIVVLTSGPPPVVEDPQPAAARDEERELKRLMGRCQAYADRESPEFAPDKCVKTCDEANEADATLGAGRISKGCQRELENEELLRSASTVIGTGLEEEGLKILVKVDPATAVFPRAKAKFDEAADILVKKYKGACKGDSSGGFFEMAYGDSCRRALQLTCNRPEGPDAEVLRWFQHSARQIGKGVGEYDCPKEYSKFQDPLGKGLGKDPRELARAAIRAMYPNPRLADAMLGYFDDGRPKQASSALKNARSVAPTREKPQYGDPILWLDFIDGKATTAMALVRTKRAKEAEALVQEVARAEARILPPGAESDLLHDVKAELAKVYAELARAECDREHFERCNEHVARGLALDPTDTNLAKMRLQMDHEALRRLTEEPDCEKTAFALSITAKDSALNQRGLELSQKLGCLKPRRPR